MTGITTLDARSRDRVQTLRRKIGLVSFSSGRKALTNRLDKVSDDEITGCVEIPPPEGSDNAVPIIECWGVADGYGCSDDSNHDQTIYAIRWCPDAGSNDDRFRELIFSLYPTSDSVMNALALVRMIDAFTSQDVAEAFECTGCGQSVHWSSIEPAENHLEIVHISQAVCERKCRSCIQTGSQPPSPDPVPVSFQDHS
jgi:hypothetical protein